MSTELKRVIGIDASRANVERRTGVEWYAFHLIQELKRIVPDTFRVVLYSREPLMDGLEVLPPHWESRVLSWPPKRLWTQGRLSWEMLVRPPDLLFSPVHVLPMILPRRAIVTVHDVAFMAMPEAYGRLGRLYLRFATWHASWFAHLLTVSEFSKTEIVKYFGADPSRIAVTPLGFDSAEFGRASADDGDAVARKHGVDGPYFLFVGRLERKKNLAGLLKAFRLFKERRPADDPYRLALIGRHGRGYEEAGAELEGSIVMKSVRELGYLPQEDVPALYAGAKAFVFPSFYEGFGLPILEAFASGTPVIASRVASIPEIAGNAALYVDPATPETIADAMARIAEDAGLRSGLIAAGRERAPRFTWRATAEKTWGEISKTLK